MNQIKKPFLSIVIPVYNEEKRIKNLVEVINYFKKQKYPWEIIVVDDGSTDKTRRFLHSLKSKLRFKLLFYSQNMGKGFAVKTGMLAAKGRYRLFLDIDLSTPIGEFSKFIPYLRKYGIVIGSRKLKKSNLLQRQSIIREHLGTLFTNLSRVILKSNISDFTCGFKCFSQTASDQIFTRQTINRWGFDSEILYIGKSKKISIKEIAITWRNDPRTKVRFPQDIINSSLELIKIRVNSLLGLYR